MQAKVEPESNHDNSFLTVGRGVTCLSAVEIAYFSLNFACCRNWIKRNHEEVPKNVFFISKKT